MILTCQNFTLPVRFFINNHNVIIKYFVFKIHSIVLLKSITSLIETVWLWLRLIKQTQKEIILFGLPILFYYFFFCTVKQITWNLILIIPLKSKGLNPGLFGFSCSPPLVKHRYAVNSSNGHPSMAMYISILNIDGVRQVPSLLVQTFCQ